MNASVERSNWLVRGACVALMSLPTLALANADVEKNIANSKNWAMQAGDMFNQRYSKLNQIHKGNVGKMQVAWTFSTGVLRGHEGAPLVIGDMMYVHTPFPNNVLLANQVFDDLGAGCWRAQATACHCRFQLFVIDHLAGAFHGGKQGCFRMTRRRLGFVGFDDNVFGFYLFASVDRNQIAIVAFLSFFPMHCQPARIDQYFAFRLERVAFNTSNTGGNQILGSREKNRKEAFDNEVIKLLFYLIQILRCLWGWDNSEVVAYFRVVEYAFIRQYPVARQDLVGKG